MKIFISTSILLFLLPQMALAKKFIIDPSHSSIEFSIKHLGIVPVKGRFKVFEGSFDVDEKKGLATNLRVQIDVDSIDTNVEDRDAHLKSKDFFHVRNDVYDIVEKNRYIVFTSPKAFPKGKSIQGQLKILKTTLPIKLKSTISSMSNAKGKGVAKIGVQAEGLIDRQKFGLTWQKASSGFLAKAAGKFVGDEVKIIINVLAEPQKANKKKK